MNDQPLVVGKLYDFKVGTQLVPGKVAQINHRVDVNTLEHVPAAQLELNSIADVVVQLDRPVAFDRYQDSRLTGAFIVIDRLSNVTVGAGMVEESVLLTNTHAPVTAEERAARLGQKPAVVAIDASLLAQADALERALLQQGIVALAKADANAEQIALVRATGITLLVADAAQADFALSADSLDELVEKVVSIVRL
jgi:sulfate adenylyltransferase subunit 1